MQANPGAKLFLLAVAVLATFARFVTSQNNIVDCTLLGGQFRCLDPSDSADSCKRIYTTRQAPPLRAALVACLPTNCITFQANSRCICSDGSAGDDNNCFFLSPFKICACTVDCQAVGAKCTSGSDSECNLHSAQCYTDCTTVGRNCSTVPGFSQVPDTNTDSNCQILQGGSCYGPLQYITKDVLNPASELRQHPPRPFYSYRDLEGL